MPNLGGRKSKIMIASKDTMETLIATHKRLYYDHVCDLRNDYEYKEGLYQCSMMMANYGYEEGWYLGFHEYFTEHVKKCGKLGCHIGIDAGCRIMWTALHSMIEIRDNCRQLVEVNNG